MPIRLHHELGLKIDSGNARLEWVSLVTGIAEFISEMGLEEEILFHGTSIRKAHAILRDGMRPTDAFEILHDGTEVMTEGSFWGTIGTAAWYAEDTAFHRTGGRPVLIACPASFFQTYSTLGVDIPSRDYEMPLDAAVIVDDIESLKRILPGSVFSA